MKINYFLNYFIINQTIKKYLTLFNDNHSLMISFDFFYYSFSFICGADFLKKENVNYMNFDVSPRTDRNLQATYSPIRIHVADVQVEAGAQVSNELKTAIKTILEE